MHHGELAGVLIVAIVMIASIIKSRYKAMGAATPRSAEPDADSNRLRDEIRTLKDRIQVLERVITDNHSTADLDREIERLRDK